MGGVTPHKQTARKAGGVVTKANFDIDKPATSNRGARGGQNDDTLILDDVDHQLEGDYEDAAKSKVQAISPFKNTNKLNDKAKYKVKQMHYQDQIKTIDLDSKGRTVGYGKADGISNRSVGDNMIKDAD